MRVSVEIGTSLNVHLRKNGMKYRIRQKSAGKDEKVAEIA
jgi:hypothetical protein